MSRASIAALLAALTLTTPAAGAEDGPRPPCQEAPDPPFADPGQPPNIRVWSAVGAAATCGAWRAEPAKRATALAGRFRHDGSLDGLLARFGRVSAMTGIRYWSVTDKRWRVLITEAHALTAAEGGRSRADFTPDEMKDGAELFFAQNDSRSSGSVTYRMRILSLAPDRLVLAIDNIGAVRLFLVTLFPPGALKSLYILERRAPGVWGYYSLGLVGMDASRLADGHPSSYANRAAALFRHIADIPTDREPPAAP